MKQDERAAERQHLLRLYMAACVRDGLLSRGAASRDLLSVAAADARCILGEALASARQTPAGAALLLGEALVRALVKPKRPPAKKKALEGKTK